ncbi:SH3 domain-containing protein [Cellulomonas sp.]|uniref:SH3 domain-containing protein n=1 Tax=Cellulomonas sp. TaxID=40001 RepID=UPI003BA9659F
MVQHVPEHRTEPDTSRPRRPAARAPDRAPPATPGSSAQRLAALQRAAGNRAVQGLVRAGGATVQRQSPVVTSGVDPLTQSITADQARTLSDSEIARYMPQLEAFLAMPASLMTAGGARHNLQVLWGESNRRRPDAGRVPDGGEPVRKPGVVAWHGDPELRLRTHPDTADATNIVRTMPLSTRLQVVKRFPGDWYFVSTADGDTGFAGSQYVRTDLPEPAARLHLVESGIPGTAIAVAEHYYGDKADNWGQDLRFYVNVLAWANKISVPDTTDGWKSVRFEAGQAIWVPSQPFAISLKGVVNSGSYSYNAADFLGVADVIERIGELLEDFGRAIDKSGQYIPESVARHVDAMLREVLAGLAKMMAVAAGVLAVTTAIGAAVGNAPGAAAGFEVGLALLEWLGLGMLVYWIGQSVVEVGSAFASFFSKVWDARGDEKKIDRAALQFAEAVGLLMAKILEALIIYITAKGLPKATRSLRGTRLGAALGETRTAQWLAERSANVAAGTSKIKGPRATVAGLRHSEVTTLTNAGAEMPAGEALAKYTPQSGFSGAYDPVTGKWVAVASGEATLLSGEPIATVPQYGGHAAAESSLMGRTGSTSNAKNVGFVLVWEGNGKLTIRWNSATINARNFGNRAAPAAVRPAIISAVEATTGCKVSE